MFRKTGLILIVTALAFASSAAIADDPLEARRGVEAVYARLGAAIGIWTQSVRFMFRSIGRFRSTESSTT
jgi:hypothetical protein